MKAAIYDQYGPPEVLRIEEIEKPQPKDNEILVKIHSASVTSGDARLRASDFPALFWLPARMVFGLFKPKFQILGHELAGTVEAVGKSVTKYQVGDEVFGTTTLLPGGAYAEYVCLPTKWKNGVVAHKPKNISNEQAATLPIGAMTALFLLEKAKIKKGQKVMIYGASGSVGSFAVQMAKIFGCEVTGVCSASNFEMVKEMGADHEIDYHNEDFTSDSLKYDIVFDAVGKISKSQAKPIMNKGCKWVSVSMMTKEIEENLVRIGQWASEGKLKSYIGHTFTLDEIVEAHRLVDSGRKRGNLSLQITPS